MKKTLLLLSFCLLTITLQAQTAKAKPKPNPKPNVISQSNTTTKRNVVAGAERFKMTKKFTKKTEATHSSTTTQKKQITKPSKNVVKPTSSQTYRKFSEAELLKIREERNKLNQK